MLRLKMEVFYAYPPERVWQVLTNPQALATWLMENDFEPRIGHKFRFQQPQFEETGLSGSIECEVIEIDEPKRLSYTWQDKLMQQPSIVTWTLTPVDGGTQLQLKHQVLQYEAIKLYQVQYPVENWQITPKSNTVAQTLQTPPHSNNFSSSFERYEVLDSVIINCGWNYKLNERLPQILSNQK